jgi:hypothetical protein
MPRVALDPMPTCVSMPNHQAVSDAVSLRARFKSKVVSDDTYHS